MPESTPARYILPDLGISYFFSLYFPQIPHSEIAFGSQRWRNQESFLIRSQLSPKHSAAIHIQTLANFLKLYHTCSKCFQPNGEPPGSEFISHLTKLQARPRRKLFCESEYLIPNLTTFFWLEPISNC